MLGSNFHFLFPSYIYLPCQQLSNQSYFLPITAVKIAVKGQPANLTFLLIIKNDKSNVFADSVVILLILLSAEAIDKDNFSALLAINF